MIEWLAVVVFCINDQCAFWANTDKPYQSEAECRVNAAQAELYFRQNGASEILTSCIPLKWIKT